MVFVKYLTNEYIKSKLESFAELHKIEVVVQQSSCVFYPFEAYTDTEKNAKFLKKNFNPE